MAGIKNGPETAQANARPAEIGILLADGGPIPDPLERMLSRAGQPWHIVPTASGSDDAAPALAVATAPVHALANLLDSASAGDALESWKTGGAVLVGRLRSLPGRLAVVDRIGLGEAPGDAARCLGDRLGIGLSAPQPPAAAAPVDLVGLAMASLCLHTDALALALALELESMFVGPVARHSARIADLDAIWRDLRQTSARKDEEIALLRATQDAPQDQTEARAATLIAEARAEAAARETRTVRETGRDREAVLGAALLAASRRAAAAPEEPTRLPSLRS